MKLLGSVEAKAQSDATALFTCLPMFYGKILSSIFSDITEGKKKRSATESILCVHKET
jgi:hypothetical protein